MIEIKNITTNNTVTVKTSHSGNQDFPPFINLDPGELIVIADDQLKLYDEGPRQNLAEYVSKGRITVTQNNGVHTYQDKGNIPTYPEWCIQGGSGPLLAKDCVPSVIPPILMKDIPDCNPYCIPISSVSTASDGLTGDEGPVGLNQAINAFINIRDTFSAHAVSTAYHLGPGSASAATDPTDLTTLIARLGTLRTEYNAHIANAIHPVNPDTWNVLPTWTLTTVADCVDAIRSFTKVFGSHRLQYVYVSTLSPLQILTY